MQTAQTKTDKRRVRISLKIKWALTVGVGIFVTFAIFAWVVYGATRNTLVQQERNTVKDTVNAVVTRMSPIPSDLQVSTVVPRLDPTPANQNPAAEESEDNSLFSDSVLQKLARQDITVTVFNRAGEVVFSSHSLPVGFQKAARLELTDEVNGDFDGIVGRSPVRSTTSDRVVGYVQVTDAMNAFHATMRQVTTVIYAAAVMALLISMVLGYFLASRFLKPIRRITDTIDIVNEEPQSSARITVPKTNDELSNLVVEFNGMLDRMQHYIDQQSDFVQDVSHELRTPVAILEGHLQLLNRWGKDDPEVLDESLRASLQEITRMKSLIQEMLDLTRADQVDVQFPNAVSDVHQTVNQVTNDFIMIHPDFTFTIDDELTGPTYVRMYRNHLEQVLIILLDNAVKYSTTRKEIHVTASLEMNSVALAVQDFGEGISPQDRKRVFNRFYRVDKARSREKGGNGLGLAIAQQLVESYKGTIQVDSAVGSGSVFRIDLPTISQAQATQLRQMSEVEPEKKPLADRSNL
ncbi:sensor histidine kinase [Lacticaseibacillus brantae]|uniref:Signal transduction histidine-protein kinase ArlS n=1 Tax=Lacticaseibacillus brantae DSM 23927 TaxID=1423727 RepID=A0A0R2B1A9_9LACO|nr:HAMP domain-containing histidine kinase [Lacticaseibacillus brantae]KRM72858.1 two component sensor transduction histidine kinase [Lacticaseibacillus brantae DSM 23927]